MATSTIKNTDGKVEKILNRIGRYFEIKSQASGLITEALKEGNMWIIIAQRPTLDNSLILLVNKTNSAYYTKELHIDSGFTWYINQYGSLEVKYENSDNVFISVVRLY